MHGVRPVLGNMGADKHAEDARNMSLDEDTLNQTSTIKTMIFDKVAYAFCNQLITSSNRKVHPPPLSSMARLSTTSIFELKPLKNP